jgi:ERCC4-type nuclease
MEEKKTLIVVDQRESPEFEKLLLNHGALIERKQLEVGDFLCSERVVIERKTKFILHKKHGKKRRADLRSS